MARTIYPSLAFGTLVLVAGLVHGLHTNRWHASDSLDEAVGRLEMIPTSMGDWVGERHDFDEESLRRAGIRGFKGFRFTNRVTGDVVSMLLVCGRSGPISVHTPDVCYGGAGFEAMGGKQTKELSVGDRSYVVSSLRFKPPASMGRTPIDVAWAWNAGDGWKSPDNPRLVLSGHPAVYKLYVVCNVRSGLEPASDPTVAFLKTCLPVLERLLARQS
jgi:hypothetical protein